MYSKATFQNPKHTSTQITEVTCAPRFTTHAVDSPFPKTAARPSCNIR